MCSQANPKQVIGQYLQEPGFSREVWIELLSLEFQVLSDAVKQQILQMHADLPPGMLVDMIARWKFKPSAENTKAVISVLNANLDACKAHKLRHDNYDQLVDCLSAAPALGSIRQILRPFIRHGDENHLFSVYCTKHACR